MNWSWKEFFKGVGFALLVVFTIMIITFFTVYIWTLIDNTSEEQETNNNLCEKYAESNKVEMKILEGETYVLLERDYINMEKIYSMCENG